MSGITTFGGHLLSPALSSHGRRGGSQGVSARPLSTSGRRGTGRGGTLGVAGALLTLLLATPAAAELSAERRGELANLLRQDCGACHGLERTGGLGPALTPERLQGRSVESLTRIILNGVPGTPMPPWDRFLSREEAAWLARQLKEEPRDAAAR